MRCIQISERWIRTRVTVNRVNFRLTILIVNIFSQTKFTLTEEMDSALTSHYMIKVLKVF